MEVHAHTHTPRRKWTHYLFEFLMLFLAVFCGFLAEYQLEHKIEKDRERQYVKSLLSDLKSDTIQLTRVINFRLGKMKTFDTIMNLLKGDWKYNTASLYYHTFFAPFTNRFVPNNGVLTQLKNAGGLRLLRNTTATDSLLNFDIQTQWLTDFEIFERDRFLDQSPWEDVLDASVFENNMNYEFPEGIFRLNRIAGNPPLLSEKQEDMDRFYNRIQQQKRMNAVMINHLFLLKLQAARLITLIRKEYHLK